MFQQISSAGAGDASVAQRVLRPKSGRSAPNWSGRVGRRVTESHEVITQEATMVQSRAVSTLRLKVCGLFKDD